MNMMSMISYTPEQEREVERRALLAAWRALESMRINPNQGSKADARAILGAFTATLNVEQEADRHLAAMNQGRDCALLCLDRHSIVANAVAMVDFPITDLQPHSARGKHMLAFTSACMAIEGYTYVTNAINNELQFNGSGHARELLTLAGMVSE